LNEVWPGSTIGILGGGQLGRMLALEAKRMGYRVGVLDPDARGPAAQVADVHIESEISDTAAARELAAISQVVTIDSEHVPAQLLRELTRFTEVRPRAEVLEQVQDRLAQRSFLGSHGLPQVAYTPIGSAEELAAAPDRARFPAVMKTRHGGYDGRGQVRVATPRDLGSAWRQLGEAPAILEEFVEFDKEVSVVLARGLDGEIRCYELAENLHRNHVLETSCAPASVSGKLAGWAEEIGTRIADALGHVGMMAVELFVVGQTLLVNEIAPRTHNSGHYTFGACATSQFEQHIRAICGLPLGDPRLSGPAVMLNLLGNSWQGKEERWSPLLFHPSVRLHLYGKREASPGRKMGHILVQDCTRESTHELADRVARGLRASSAAGGSDSGGSDGEPALSAACAAADPA